MAEQTFSAQQLMLYCVRLVESATPVAEPVHPAHPLTAKQQQSNPDAQKPEFKVRICEVL
jgi:hypothetical protein